MGSILNRNFRTFLLLGRTLVVYHGRRKPIIRRPILGLTWKRRVRPLLRLTVYVRGRYRPLKRRGRYWYTFISPRWVRVIRGKSVWYYRSRNRWLKLKPVRLSARVGRRRCSIRPRGRKLYARIGRRYKRVKTRFIRYVRFKGKRFIVKRRGRKVILFRKGRRTRPLAVVRSRKWKVVFWTYERAQFTHVSSWW